MGELNDECVTIFDVEIDRVLFGSAVSNMLPEILASLNDTHESNEPTGADIEKLVNDYVENIRFHILEG